MNIKSLELNNFQKHEHLLLNFTEGVNVIVGSTDCGKSTIIRAIRWVFYPGELRGDVVRKEGTKKTSVKIILDNKVVIERIKTSVVNSYKLTIEGKETEYNATGNILPEDIQKVIKFIPIEIDNDKLILNIANQIAMPFLLDKSGTFRQKLFNKLTGNDILDQAMQGLNKDILNIGKETKFLIQQRGELTVSLMKIKIQREQAEKATLLFAKKVEDIKALNERLEELKKCKEELTKVDIQLSETKQGIHSIKSISAEVIKIIKQQIIKLDNYLTLQKEINKINNELKITNASLSMIKVPTIDIKKYINESDRLVKLIKLKENIFTINDSLQLCIPKAEKYNKEIKDNEEKKKEILKSITICPFHNVECPLNKEKK